MTHVPLFLHAKIEYVLAIGSFHGCVAREVFNCSVKYITICDLDSMPIEVAKQFLQQMSTSLSKEKVTIIQEDDAKFLE